MARGDIRIFKKVKVGTLASGKKLVIPKERKFAPGIFQSMAKSIVSPEIKAQIKQERARRRKQK